MELVYSYHVEGYLEKHKIAVQGIAEIEEVRIYVPEPPVPEAS
jgi:hypothetical protein